MKSLGVEARDLVIKLLPDLGDNPLGGPSRTVQFDLDDFGLGCWQVRRAGQERR